ncbi:MAG TPA: UPF0146 family protein [Candidatus Thermoplasmatota archaeon]|nr:UPF0146 family protein [Candidatus Thermoplasmatota archaeon]
MVPRRLLSRFGSARKVVEVGVGNDASTALEWIEAGVAEVVVTDVHPRDVPPRLLFALDDVTEPRASVYSGAALVYGVRLPEELQASAARAAIAARAAFAARALKDEWADLSHLYGGFETMGGGWRLYRDPLGR